MTKTITGAKFMRVQGGRYTVVLPADLETTVLKSLTVSGIPRKDGTTADDVRLTGEIHKRWEFPRDSGTFWTAFYTVPKPITGKGAAGRGKGARVPAAQVPAALATIDPDYAAFLAWRDAQNASAPVPTPEPVTENAVLTRTPVRSRTVKSGARVASSRPRGASRSVALLD